MTAITAHPSPPAAGDQRVPILTWGWLLVGLTVGLLAYQVMVGHGLGHPAASVWGLGVLLACTGGGWLRASARRPVA